MGMWGKVVRRAALRCAVPCSALRYWGLVVGSEPVRAEHFQGGARGQLGGRHDSSGETRQQGGCLTRPARWLSHTA